MCDTEEIWAHIKNIVYQSLYRAKKSSIQAPLTSFTCLCSIEKPLAQQKGVFSIDGIKLGWTGWGLNSSPNRSVLAGTKGRRFGAWCWWGGISAIKNKPHWCLKQNVEKPRHKHYLLGTASAARSLRLITRSYSRFRADRGSWHWCNAQTEPIKKYLFFLGVDVCS